MCGITGIFSHQPVQEDTIRSMTSALDHRGPDAHGLFIAEGNFVALGHTRLSIIDLSSVANQPFHAANGRFIVVFNGEIYNYLILRRELHEKHGVLFRTESDTEVIAEAFTQWGLKMVERLDGMFAIAVYDKDENKLFLFRDRIGKKPLYYYQAPGYFIFASEIKSLLKHPFVQQTKNIDKSTIASFLHLGYIPEPRTIYKKIYKFPSGNSGVVDRQLILKLSSYWSVNEKIVTPDSKDEKTAVHHLNLLLEESVRKRLISDVPLGAFLSGGTDSSLITAIASKQVANPLKTFNIGFKENKFNESFYADEVAKCLNTDHTSYILSEREAIDLLETYVHHFDEPFADTSAIPTMLVSKLTRQDVKVALTGDGGDELFQGYGSYNWAQKLGTTRWKMGKGILRQLFLLRKSSRYERIAHLLEHVDYRSIRSHIFSQEQYFFSQREIANIILKEGEYSGSYRPFNYDESFLNHLKLKEGEKQAVFDLNYYLKDDLLVKVDRASMFYALECRCPFLDESIVEYSLKLDYGLKVKAGRNKWLLKQLLSRYLPDQLVNRPKWGFSIPLGKWLKKDLRYLLNDYLNESIVQETGIFSWEIIDKLKKDFLGGKEYLYNRLWVLIILHKWLKEYKYEG